MGIPMISFDGLVIRQAKRFILECHICKILFRDSSKLFCSSCGNNSLLKVSCSVNSDGTLILYRKKGFQVNSRGQQVWNRGGHVLVQHPQEHQQQEGYSLHPD